MTTLILNIQGMTCNGCLRSVKEMLNNLEGVNQAKVTLEPAQAIIEYDEKKLSVSNLIEAIEDAGFDATTASH